MDNKSIKEYIYKNCVLTQEDRLIKWKFNIYFEKASNNKLPGTYIFSDKKGYHVEDVGDRGGIVCRKVYNNIDDLAYDVLKYMTWSCACDYSESHKFEGVDRKDLVADYQLVLMKKINVNYYHRFVNELTDEKNNNRVKS